jgi:SecD/SecF fusion protein
VRQGVTAAIAGLALTLLFVLIYYRFAGFVALIGLTVNMLILFGAMAMFGATFTLPGIAGIILTIGVAVDANVLIYERLREEIGGGKISHQCDPRSLRKGL